MLIGEGKPLGRPRRRWEDNILRGIGYGNRNQEMKKLQVFALSEY